MYHYYTRTLKCVTCHLWLKKTTSLRKTKRPFPDSSLVPGPLGPCLINDFLANLMLRNLQAHRWLSLEARRDLGRRWSAQRSIQWAPGDIVERSAAAVGNGRTAGLWKEEGLWAPVCWTQESQAKDGWGRRRKRLARWNQGKAVQVVLKPLERGRIASTLLSHECLIFYFV